jgi:hypothetical protein
MFYFRCKELLSIALDRVSFTRVIYELRDYKGVDAALSNIWNMTITQQAKDRIIIPEKIMPHPRSHTSRILMELLQFCGIASHLSKD